MEISSLFRRLVRSFHYADFACARLDLNALQNINFRISIRTLNSNDHFTLSQLLFPLSFTYSFCPSLSLSLSLSLSCLVSIEVWSKHIFQRLLSLNILSKCFSFITHCTNANSFEPMPNSMPTAFSPFVLSSRTLVSFAFTEIPVVSCAAYS